jgi:hypothetical protein
MNTPLVKQIAISGTLFLLFILPLTASNPQDSIPTVFKIGDYEEQFAQLSKEYHTSLVEVNNDQLEMVDFTWQELLMQMEYHALKIEFDLNGIQIWLHIFWNQTGGIDHIAYHLKTESRYVDNEELNAFLRYFRRQYSSTVRYTTGYNHYSDAGFPLSFHMGKKR